MIWGWVHRATARPSSSASMRTGACRVSSSAPSAIGALHLLGQGGHVLLAAAVDAGHPVRPQADGAAGHVHGHVAAADDHHLLAGEVGQVAVADATQQSPRRT